MRRSVRTSLVAFACGATFAVGLAVAGMEHPATVLDAFSVSSSWDARLLVMFLAAVLVHAPLAAWIRRRRPEARVATGRVDARLVLGSVLFGLGWGLAGICPGPAFTAALAFAPPVITFLAGFAAGLVIHRVTQERPRFRMGALSREGVARSHCR